MARDNEPYGTACTENYSGPPGDTRSVWGTTARPNSLGTSDGGTGSFTVNGVNYSRVHGASGAASNFAEYQPFMTGPRDQAIYDETYGWGVPLSVLTRGKEAGAFDQMNWLNLKTAVGPMCNASIVADFVAQAS